MKEEFFNVHFPKSIDWIHIIKQTQKGFKILLSWHKTLNRWNVRKYLDPCPRFSFYVWQQSTTPYWLLVAFYSWCSYSRFKRTKFLNTTRNLERESAFGGAKIESSKKVAAIRLMEYREPIRFTSFHSFHIHKYVSMTIKVPLIER